MTKPKTAKKSAPKKAVVKRSTSRVAKIRKLTTQQIVLYSVVVIFGLLALWMFQAVHADTFKATAEAESGTTSGNAAINSNVTDASGNGSVTFKNGTSQGTCTIDPTVKLQDQDPTDEQLPWRRKNGEEVVINFETKAVTVQSYKDDMAKGVLAWDKSPCIKPQLVDTCAAGTNCVKVVLQKTPAEAGDDGNFDAVEKSGYTTGGTIEYYTDPLTKEGPSAQTNVVIHEMGHAVGLAHRKTPNVLMNGETAPGVYDPDAIDYQNLLVDYANQK